MAVLKYYGLLNSYGAKRRNEMENILDKRIPLAHLPTPLQHFPRLSDQYEIDLYIKRDDLTESVASGNKLRKMEYVLYEAKEHEADTLVTCGGIQSNHCRAVAWVAAKENMESVLLLRGEKPSTAHGNLLIDRILGAQTRFFTKDDFQHINEIGASVCEELSNSGKKPYYIPMGASIATGSLGYIRMIKEIVDQEIAFDHIYCATGSGGTLAGIMAGCQYFDMGSQIHGIAVCDDTAYFIEELERIQQEFETNHEITLDISGCERIIDDRFKGIGYALNTKEELQTLVQIARTEGLVLDPVYSLKAFIGMIEHIREGTIHPGDRVLFVHTGGHYGLFPKNEELEAVL